MNNKVNYKNKYIKYKNKYLKLKKNNILIGGNKIVTDVRHIKSHMNMQTYLQFDDSKLLKFANKEFYKELIESLIKLKIDPKNSIALDLGSGHGNNTISLAYHFKQIYGVDPSDPMLKQSKINLERVCQLDRSFSCSNIEFIKGDFYNLPKMKFDVIFMFNSIHYSDNVENTLNNIFQHLNENGILYISEPNSGSKFGDSRLNVKGHLRFQKIKGILETRKKIKEYIKNKNIKIISEIETPVKHQLYLKFE